ncbi:hypothetical protein MKJ04_11930 [Pontibacter sp. E15-1]|uniref:hypothetical protein n=1 Tax=Pontibacter sp. E15-1 TaxID=2919918 RepID=UPI001F4FD477|nr:hypothetical protein [Pontibacter sp. E15-1]MCJ8165550.1 hypothetical protein [Pontibacter sp. E15-1]
MQRLIKQYLIYSISAVVLAGCGHERQGTAIPEGQGIDSVEAVQEEPNRKGEPTMPDTSRFEEDFTDFLHALQSGDTAALNGFVSAQTGFWLIEQPGALPAYTHYTAVQDVRRSYQQLPFTSISRDMGRCDLLPRQVLPEFDCGAMDGTASGYTEDGCFYTSNTAGFRNTDMWQYASLTDQQAEQVQELQQQVAITVLHTASYFRFHFGYRKGRWQLLFADLRIPCSA